MVPNLRPSMKVYTGAGMQPGFVLGVPVPPNANYTLIQPILSNPPVNLFITIKLKKMKKQIKTLLLLMGTSLILNISCRKNDHPVSPCDSSGENNADLQNAQLIKLGADVPAKWYALAIKLSRTTPNQSPGPSTSRTFGYMGLALYESVVPGMPACDWLLLYH